MSHCIEPDPFPTPRAHTPSRVVVASRSHVGQERPENEDRVLVGCPSGGQAWEPPCAMTLELEACGFFALVCDGMGGEVGGEIASTLAIEVINACLIAWWAQLAAIPAGSPRIAEERLGRAMKASIDTASARIKSFAREHPRYARMGTTATLAALSANALLVAQVGDSRAYAFRSNQLVQLTRDQTMAELIRAQTPSLDRNAEVVGANVILQAVGASTKLDIVLTRHEIVHGDVVLLCSDGLSGPVDDRDIEAILQREHDLGAACDALVTAANAAGGPDNVSCVAFRVDRSV